VRLEGKKQRKKLGEMMHSLEKRACGVMTRTSDSIQFIHLYSKITSIHVHIYIEDSASKFQRKFFGQTEQKEMK